jgi:hypothetical protein
VRTRQHVLGPGSLVEVQIQNVTQGAMSIERVRFGPGVGWDALDLAAGASQRSATDACVMNKRPGGSRVVDDSFGLLYFVFLLFFVFSVFATFIHIILFFFLFFFPFSC